MKNMFNVTTVLPHNLLQTNPYIRHNFSTQVFRKRAAQLHYVGPELRYIFWPFLASFGGGLTDSALCRCGAEEETSAHVWCECEDLATLRHIYWGSFFLDPEDVKPINFHRPTGNHQF